MTGVWVEAGIAAAACVVALTRRAALRVSRNGIPYTPRHKG